MFFLITLSETLIVYAGSKSINNIFYYFKQNFEKNSYNPAWKC